MIHDRLPLCDTLVCDRCSGEDILHLRRVCDWNTGPEPLALARDATGLPYGHFEMCVCRGCGYIDWLGVADRPLTADPAAGLRPDARRTVCQVCLAPRRWRLGPVRELGAGFDDPVPMQLEGTEGSAGRASQLATLEVDFCEGCGQVSWLLGSSTSTGDRLPAAVVEGERVICAGCDGITAPVTRAADLSRWGGWIDRCVAYDSTRLNPRTWGHLEVAACEDCRLVSWFARDIDDLPEGAATQATRLVERRRPFANPYR